jgi:uncharacterized protein DUF5658
MHPDAWSISRRASRRSWLGDAAFLLFIVAQISDGLFTYLGIAAFRLSIEANPLIVWSVSTFGLGSAIIAIKLFAVTCGAVLHLNAMHRTIGALTLVYLVGAVLPWTRVFVAGP